MDYAAVASEMKFVVDETTATAIREWARRELSPDPHAAEPDGDGYETASLYFDTPQFDLFHRRGSTGRAKFRIRRYNGGPVVFLERKMRTGGRVTKRRSEILEPDLRLLLNDGEKWAGRWFARRLTNRGLQPVCQISYNRMARVGGSPARRLRLTLDGSLAAAPIRSIAFLDSPGIQILPGEAILELKFPVDTPALFEDLIARFDLRVRSMSKYRLAIRALGLAGAAGAASSR
ncbi:MAG TPA: polyphosphate polymerase domain-containing protein [Terriglobia bacterium]|nr:polyphosphate polymerase domain-containing protein [Terriglobia bacterium]